MWMRKDEHQIAESESFLEKYVMLSMHLNNRINQEPDNLNSGFQPILVEFRFSGYLNFSMWLT